MQKVKIQKLHGKKKKEQRFYENVQCGMVKNQNLSNWEKLVDY